MTTEGVRGHSPQFLGEDLWRQATEHPAGLSPSQSTRWHLAREREIEWKVSIPVDGRPVEFSSLAEGRMWVAYAEVEGCTVMLRGRDMPVESIELVRINDIRPYTEGTKRLREEQRRIHGH